MHQMHIQRYEGESYHSGGLATGDPAIALVAFEGIGLSQMICKGR